MGQWISWISHVHALPRLGRHGIALSFTSHCLERSIIMRTWLITALLIVGFSLVTMGCESSGDKGSGSKDGQRQSGSGSK